MNLFGNRQRLCFSGWILAALIVVAFNGLEYVSLESRPLEGHSRTIKLLRLKLSRLESATANKLADVNGLDTMRMFFARYFHANKNQPLESTQLENEPHLKNPVEIVLPTLSGIVQVLDHQGLIRYQAVLNGKVCQQKDQLLGFTVGKISTEGVELHKMGQRQFIKSPVIYYSNDQGK